MEYIEIFSNFRLMGLGFLMFRFALNLGLGFLWVYARLNLGFSLALTLGVGFL